LGVLPDASQLYPFSVSFIRSGEGPGLVETVADTWWGHVADALLRVVTTGGARQVAAVVICPYYSKLG
jgi:hypothetical protein